MKATDFVNCPTTKEELLWRLAAVFAIDANPIPWRMDPHRVATNAMAARE